MVRYGKNDPNLASEFAEITFRTLNIKSDQNIGNLHQASETKSHFLFLVFFLSFFFFFFSLDIPSNWYYPGCNHQEL